MKIAIIGMGLIGASLAEAILKYTSHEVYGYDVSTEVLKRADELSAHTRALADSDFKNLDLVVFALNPDIAISEMKRICPLLKNGATVADTCGIKRIICGEMTELRKKYPTLHFVGTHPMAGREYSGIDYSEPNLFNGAYLILAPIDGDAYPVALLNRLALEIGFKGVEVCSAERHDEMIAYTSQLAHAVSSCYVQNPHSKEHAGYSAGSFADLTRVARLNPDMWTELFLQNKDNLINCIDDIAGRLKEMSDALKDGDEAKLKQILAQGSACKEIADSALKEKNNE
ncbi:MAG: prephenate dehydrogenase [Bacteroides sp.]|nr:prephenate dehydrogenase [Bacillota bacterium]MCM1393674.1 prephenate dehydrogenase [[Eubacterium] siraeum]MCM1455227.1 prephenate dehydrogenase [Bacteroides sp.]